MYFLHLILAIFTFVRLNSALPLQENSTTEVAVRDSCDNCNEAGEAQYRNPDSTIGSVGLLADGHCYNANRDMFFARLKPYSTCWFFYNSGQIQACSLEYVVVSAYSGDDYYDFSIDPTLEIHVPWWLCMPGEYSLQQIPNGY